MDGSILALSAVVVGCIIAGSIACLPLFHWDLNTFFTSSLWTKISMWLPIYAVILISLVTGPIGGTLLIILLAAQAVVEFKKQANHQKIPLFGSVYFILFLLSLGAAVNSFWIVGPSIYLPFMSVVYFGSVISDVTAFFAGTYIKRWALPSWINERKSWYGVIGQLLGGVIGVWIAASILEFTIPWWFGLMIGTASAVGDIANSIVKRQLRIKDWGQTIPGHGGILDRCSSLSLAFLSVLLYLLIKVALPE